MTQATMQNLKLILLWLPAVQFLFSFFRLAFPMQHNNIPKIFLMFTVIFYVHIKDVQVSAKVCTHLCILPIAGYPR